MRETSKITKLEKHIDTLQKQVRKLSDENTLLKRENAALLERVELANKVIMESEENIRECRKLKSDLDATIKETVEMRDKYSKLFKEQLKRISKQR